MNGFFRFCAIQDEAFNEKALNYSTNKDPVGLLINCRKRGIELRAGTRCLHWQLVTTCYAGAYGIRQRPELFLKLLEDDYFAQRTYTADQDDLLRLALLIGTDADVRGPTYKKACSIASRLQPLFDAEVEPMEVLKRIEAAGGLKGLDISDLVTEASKSDAEGQTDDAEDVGLSDDDDDEWDDYPAEPSDDHEDSDTEPAARPRTMCSPARSGSSGRQTTTSGSTKARKGQATVKQGTAQPKQTMTTSQEVTHEPDDDLVILEVEITREKLSMVLNADLSLLSVRCVGLSENWQRVVCATVESSH